MSHPFSWQDAAAASALSTGVVAIVAYLLFPRCKEQVWLIIEGDLLRSERHMKKALEKELTYMYQLPTIAESMKQNAKAFEVVADRLKEIHEEVQEHSKRFERWDGFMEGMEGKWSGNERRGSGRRKLDHDDKG